MIELSSEQLKEIRETLDNEVEESLKLLDDTLNRVVNKLAEEGWALPCEFGIYLIYRMADSDEIKDVNAFMKWYYSEHEYFHTKNMVYYIKNASIREGLKVLFDECWKAFQSGLYAVCANSLISIIEGILSEYSDDKNDIRMMKVCQKKVDTFSTDGSIIEKHVWISYNMFIRKLYVKSDFTSIEPGEINRHWLLHGRSNYEIEEIDCIRLMSAIQSICTIYNLTVHKEKKE